MAEKKKFLLRVDPDLYDALERWAADELRSVNGQIEYLLTEALRKAGRGRGASPPGPVRDTGPPPGLGGEAP